MLPRAAWWKLTDVSEMHTASVTRAMSSSSVSVITLVMEALRTSETSVNFYETTRRNILESCHLYYNFS
jgi:hypothetical protein